jgi:hypothetical protein
MCACVHVCMGAWVHVCMCACVHVCMGAWVHVCMCAWVHGCMGAWVHVCMCACVHVCMGAWVHGCMGAWVHGCMCACVHARMGACVHVRMCACAHGCMGACVHARMDGAAVWKSSARPEPTCPCWRACVALGQPGLCSRGSPMAWRADELACLSRPGVCVRRCVSQVLAGRAPELPVRRLRVYSQRARSAGCPGARRRSFGYNMMTGCHEGAGILTEST